MEMSLKQLQLIKEALTCYRSEIDRATQPEYANEFLLSLTAPFIEVKRQEIENLSTLVDIMLEEDS